MSVLIAIPARFASTRYPGKPLAELKGATGQSLSLIERSWRAACAVNGVDRVVVATDDNRIKDAAEAFGAEVVMTSTECANGTERCAEAHAALGGGFDIVVNLQGDAPLTPHWFVESLVQGLISAPDAEIATPVLRCDGATLNALSDRPESGSRRRHNSGFCNRSQRDVFLQRSRAIYVKTLFRDGYDPCFPPCRGVCLSP